MRSRSLTLSATLALLIALGAGSASAAEGGAGEATADERAATPTEQAAGDGKGAAGGPPQPTPPGEAVDPTGPGAGEAPEPDPIREAKLKLRMKGVRGGKLKVGKRTVAAGTLRPYVAGERVSLVMKRGKKVIKRKTVTVKRKKKGSNLGQFAFHNKVIKSGRYSVVATHARSSELSFERSRPKKFKIKYPSLKQGNRSSQVKLLNRLLGRQGYVTGGGASYSAATGRAVLAFRKVNKMPRRTSATSSIFKKLAAGKGGYRIRRPKSGKHVEIDISRQIMVLAKGRKVKEIYHVSTGAAATPTIPGTWRFYRKQPGLNSIGMYYSVYYNRGYATHGYKSVPNYPASHGCTRNPPPDSRHIYNWIDIGDRIHVFR